MQVSFYRLLVGALWLVCCVAGMPAKASTLILVFDTNSLPGIQSSVPTLTLNFGNSTDNATTFTGADFLSRILTNVDLIPLPAAFFPSYPEANLANTTVTIGGSVDTSSPLVLGFSYVENDPALGFAPISMSYETGTTMRGPWLWSAGNGGYYRFYLGSSTYDATGTPADFAPGVSSVPLPAALPLLASGMGGLGLFGWRKKRKATARAA